METRPQRDSECPDLLRGASNDDPRASAAGLEVTVLLVEDDSDYAEYVSELLRSRAGGYAEEAPVFHVVHVKTLSGALEELDSGKVFDLVLLDPGLPDSGGLDSLIRIREHAPEIPIIVVSSTQDDLMAIEAVRHGAQDYLSKDVVHAKMLVRVAWYTIERKRAREELQLTTRELRQLTGNLATTNRELERKNEEMEGFVYTVSHDLKSPLVTMKGFVGLLQEDIDSGDRDAVMDSIGRIEKAATHMSRLIEDLLKLSRAGRLRGRIESIDMAALVREVTASLQPRLDELAVSLEIEEGIPGIVADRAAISRVLENLLGNCIKYACGVPNPRITVGSRTVEGEVRVFVKDNGPGIAPEHHERIFGLFQRLDSDQDGTGVGLAIVSKIMQVHDGRVWVESSPGAGATFWLSFPRACAAVPESV